jgi:hypothetical protein
MAVPRSPVASGRRSESGAVLVAVRTAVAGSRRMAAGSQSVTDSAEIEGASLRTYQTTSISCIPVDYPTHGQRGNPGVEFNRGDATIRITVGSSPDRLSCARSVDLRVTCFSPNRPQRCSSRR